jgi:hypothetical protein
MRSSDALLVVSGVLSFLLFLLLQDNNKKGKSNNTNLVNVSFMLMFLDVNDRLALRGNIAA